MNPRNSRGPLLIAGAAGHAKVVARLAELSGYEVEGFADKTARSTQFLGKEVRALAEWPRDLPTVVAIGNPLIRSRLFGELLQQNRCIPALIHPDASVDDPGSLGAGTVVLAGAVISVDAKIGMASIIGHNAVVDHDCQLGDFVHVAPGATIAGAVVVGTGAWIGIGAVVLQQLCIGKWTMIGGGAVVTKSVPDDVTAVGIPARVISHTRRFGTDHNSKAG